MRRITSNRKKRDADSSRHGALPVPSCRAEFGINKTFIKRGNRKTLDFGGSVGAKPVFFKNCHAGTQHPGGLCNYFKNVLDDVWRGG